MYRLILSRGWANIEVWHMKKPVAAVVAAISMVFAAGAAHAAEFMFSYTFDTGDTVSGTFDGTGTVGTEVTNITNVNVVIDGVALTGPLYAYFYTGYTGPNGSNCGDSSCFSGSGAFASANPAINNFVFANGSPTDIGSRTNYFYIIPWTNGPGNQVATQGLQADGNLINLYNGQYVPANWSLVEVPEPATWAMMLFGLGCLGASWRLLRRKPGAALAAN